MSSAVRALAFSVLLAACTGGCLISKGPLLDPGGRALPFASGTRFELYERENPAQPWKLNEKVIVLVADADKVVREADEAGNVQGTETYEFYPVGPDRYLVQARFSPERHAYGLLEIKAGEGILIVLQCGRYNPEMLKREGIKVSAEDCVLDGARDPKAVLSRLAERPEGAQLRYVPVTKK